jgi:hypothetical protein
MKKHLILIPLGLLVVGFAGWRYAVSRSRTVPHHGIVIDKSGSRPERCSTGGIARRILSQSPVAPGSTMSLFFLGDNSDGYNPRIRTEAIPFDHRVMESTKRVAARQTAFVNGLQAACQAASRPMQSAVFKAVERALEHLRAAGCKPESQCVLWVDTDGHENVDEEMKNLLRHMGGGSQGSPPRLDNAGVQVTLCGLAETHVVSPRNSKRAGSRSVPEVWVSQFTRPENVSVQPYCQ